MYVCVGVWGICVHYGSEWRSEDNVQESIVLFFYHMDAGD